VVPDRLAAAIVVVQGLQVAAIAVVQDLQVAATAVVQDLLEAAIVVVQDHQAAAAPEGNYLLHNCLELSNQTGYRIFHIQN